MTEPTLTQTSRRRGHRTQELLLTVKKIHLRMVLLALLVTAAGVYLLGHNQGYQEAIVDEELRLKAITTAPEESLPPQNSADFLVVPLLKSEPASTTSSTAPPAVETKVEEKVATKPKQKEIAATKRKPKKGFFGLQLGAFKTRIEAKRFVQQQGNTLRKLPVFLIDIKLKSRGTWTRVRVGEFASRKAAARLKSTLPAKLKRGSILVSYR